MGCVVQSKIPSQVAGDFYMALGYTTRPGLFIYSFIWNSFNDWAFDNRVEYHVGPYGCVLDKRFCQAVERFRDAACGISIKMDDAVVVCANIVFHKRHVFLYWVGFSIAVSYHENTDGVYKGRYRIIR